MGWQQWARGFLLALAVVSSTFLAYLLLTRTESTSPRTPELKPLHDQADAGMEQFTFTQTKDGVVQWEVRAKQASLYEDQNHALLKTVEVTLFGERGRELTVHGDEARLNTSNHNFEIANRERDLVIHLQGGYTIYTNHVQWTDERQEIETQDPVVIEGKGMRITGRGLLGKVEREEFQVLDDVRVDLGLAQ
ncbi:MAG: LPS export ABC transporter periplasmic protein LptC [Nitrospiraceae bacterium]